MGKGNILLISLLTVSTLALKADYFSSASPQTRATNYNFTDHKQSSTGSLLVILTLLGVVGGFVCYMIYLCKRKCEEASRPNLNLPRRQGSQPQNVNNFNDSVNPEIFDQDGTAYDRNGLEFK